MYICVLQKEMENNMKKLILILTCIFTLSTYVLAQNCNFYVDTATKYVNCGDSIQLSSCFFMKSRTLNNIRFIKSVFFTDINTGYIGGDQGICKTTNAGYTWQSINNNYIIHSIYFLNSNTGFAVGYGGGLFKTIDAGNTWIQLSGPFNFNDNFWSITFTDAKTGYVVGSKIIKTTDAGKNWFQLKNPSTYCYLNSVYFIDANSGYAVGGIDSTNRNSLILKTTNAGTTWTKYILSTSAYLNCVYFTDSNNGYAVGDEGTIFKTTNAGTSWSQLSIPIFSDFHSIYFINRNIGYAVGDYSKIITTNDAGNTWNQLSNIAGNTDYLWSIYFKDPTIAYIVGWQNEQGPNQQGIIIKLNDFNNATYLWQPKVGLSNPNIPNPKVKPERSATYKVNITPNSGTGCNTYTDSLRIIFIPPPAPEICMVSVRSNKNLVIWNKPAITAIDSFLIWRETNVTNVYAKIGETAYKDSSIFLDTTSNPLIQSNKYKISIKDNCKVESYKSISHKTMHLTINQGTGNTWNLIWEPYEGFTVSSYKIYRGTSANNISLIGTTSGSNTQYSDYNAPAGYIYYQIEVVNSNQCSPSKSNKFSSSLSNIATNDPTYSINEMNKYEKCLLVYPNPANEMLNVECSMLNKKEKIEAEMFDVVGNKVKSEMLSQTNNKINVADLSAGVYILRLSNASYSTIKKIIIEH
jgi:photosystem II stability/assembly factor-like uncharacterized protein